MWKLPAGSCGEAVEIFRKVNGVSFVKSAVLDVRVGSVAPFTVSAAVDGRVGNGALFPDSAVLHDRVGGDAGELLASMHASQVICDGDDELILTPPMEFMQRR